VGGGHGGLGGGRAEGERAVSYALEFRETPAGVELVGEAPERIHVTAELLNNSKPELVNLNDRGDVMFTLTNTVLWYRRVGLVDGDPRVVEFERVA
jgi:hypothetical protein